MVVTSFEGVFDSTLLSGISMFASDDVNGECVDAPLLSESSCFTLVTGSFVFGASTTGGCSCWMGLCWLETISFDNFSAIDAASCVIAVQLRDTFS